MIRYLYFVTQAPLPQLGSYFPRPAMWPVKPAAMRAEPTPRIHELARPKPSYDDIKRGESEGKSKTAGRKNAKDKSARSKKEPVIYADVPRFISLSEPKKLTTHYIENRSTPEWHLKPSTLKARPSSRISELAKPKQLHKDWQADRPSHTSISESPQYAEGLPRTDFLAQPKAYVKPPAKETYLWDYPYWDHEISEATKTYSASERIVKLAKPKGDYEGYAFGKSLEEPIPDSVLNYSATEKIQGLAQPKAHAAASKTENPFIISEAAKNVNATARLVQLATPIPRKVTYKKLG